MEQNKWQLVLHEDCEDPYYEITNGPISLIANCGFIGEDDADEENIFNRVKDELNVSGIKFHSGNKLELQQHIEIQKQQYEIAAIQSKCDRYEKALKEIAKTALVVGQPSFMWQANEALNGEGEKEVKAPENKPLPCGNCGGPGDNYIGNQYYLCDKCMESPENI